jgi:hypothetical protein
MLILEFYARPVLTPEFYDVLVVFGKSHVGRLSNESGDELSGMPNLRNGAASTGKRMGHVPTSVARLVSPVDFNNPGHGSKGTGRFLQVAPATPARGIGAEPAVAPDPVEDGDHASGYSSPARPRAHQCQPVLECSA